MNKTLRTSAISLVSAVILFSSLITLAQTTVTVGTGTLSDYNYPFYTYYETERSQILYLGSEIGQSGTITKIAFDIKAAAVTAQNAVNFTIKMKEVTDVNWNSNSNFIDMTAATTVYGPVTENALAGTVGWKEFNLSTLFTYNNINNLAIEISFGQNSGYSSTKPRVNCTSTTTSMYSVLYGYQASAPPVSYDGKDYYRPNIKITLAASCSQPTTQASGISASNITTNSMTLNWTRGNGDNILVVAKAGSAPTDPVCGTSYNASAAFGSGSACGGGYVVYNGTGTSVPVTNLAAGTTYYYAIYEYYNSGYCYKIPALTGNTPTLKNAPSTQASSIIFSDVVCASMTVNFTAGNGEKRIVKINTVNNFTNPTDGTDPTANPVYGGSGEQVVYNNNGNSINVSGLSVNTTYWFRIYEYNNSGVNTKYNVNTATANPGSQLTLTSCSMTWLGNTTLWETGSNWLPAGPPTVIYDVIIPSSPAGGSQPAIGGSAVCNNITNNGTISMNHDSYSLTVNGSYNGSGTFAGWNNSAVYFSGNADVQISGPAVFPIIRISKSSASVKVTAAGNITASTVYLDKGILDMGASGYDLTTNNFSVEIFNGGKLYVHDAGTLCKLQGGHLYLNTGGTIDIDAGEVRITYGVFDIPGGSLDMSGGIIRQQTFVGTIGYGSQWGDNTNGCNITISGGDIYFEDSHFTVMKTNSVNISGGTIHCANSMWTTTGSNWDPTAGTVEMYGSVYNGQLHNADDENSWLYDLIITKSGATKCYHGGPSSSAYDDIVVKNNVYIASGSTLSAKEAIAANYQGKMIIYGNWDNDNGGTYEEESGRVTFKGANNSIVYGPAAGETFYKLTISKMSKIYTVNLTNHIMVSRILTLNSGTITTGAYYVKMTNGWYDDVVDGSANNYLDSWIYGNLQRYLDDNNRWFDLPVGTATVSYLAKIFYLSSSDDHKNLFACFDAGALTGNTGDLNVIEDGTPYTSISPEGVWKIDPDVAFSGTYNIRCYINNFSGLSDNMYAILKRPASSTSNSDWTCGTCGIGVGLEPNGGDGRILSYQYALRKSLTSFSQFAIAKTGGSLPVDLISFDADCSSGQVALKWTTASETNNDFFTVERSMDSGNWEVAKIIGGAGNSNTPTNYSVTDVNPDGGYHYYRLKQTDYDGNFEYFGITTVNCVDEQEMLGLSWNAEAGNLSLNIFSAEQVNAAICIVNILGQKVFYSEYYLIKGVNKIDLDVSAFAGSSYLLTVKTQSGNFLNEKILIN
ncbi:MAG: hypothetical protein V1904_13675 [Bacteroidota bacterium]